MEFTIRRESLTKGICDIRKIREAVTFTDLLGRIPTTRNSSKLKMANTAQQI